MLVYLKDISTVPSAHLRWEVALVAEETGCGLVCFSYGDLRKRMIREAATRSTDGIITSNTRRKTKWTYCWMMLLWFSGETLKDLLDSLGKKERKAIAERFDQAGVPRVYGSNTELGMNRVRFLFWIHLLEASMSSFLLQDMNFILDFTGTAKIPPARDAMNGHLCAASESELVTFVFTSYGFEHQTDNILHPAATWY